MYKRQDKASQTLNRLKQNLPYEDKIKFAKTKRVFDSSKVDSHSAIIPTYIVPNSLTPDEQIVYQAIKDRFIANFMPPAEYENTEIKTDVDDSVFLTKDVYKRQVVSITSSKWCPNANLLHPNSSALLYNAPLLIRAHI